MLIWRLFLCRRGEKTLFPECLLHIKVDVGSQMLQFLVISLCSAHTQLLCPGSIVEAVLGVPNAVEPALPFTIPVFVTAQLPVWSIAHFFSGVFLLGYLYFLMIWFYVNASSVTHLFRDSALHSILEHLALGEQWCLILPITCILSPRHIVLKCVIFLCGCVLLYIVNQSVIHFILLKSRFSLR